MLLILPIPNSELAINKSKGWHWSQHSSLRKKARQDGYYLALEYCSKYGFYEKIQYDVTIHTGEWCLIINAYFANNKHLDDDNLLSALKNYRDGVFDYLKFKYGMNDKQITYTILDTSKRDKNNPHIEWILKPRCEEDFIKEKII